MSYSHPTWQVDAIVAKCFSCYIVKLFHCLECDLGYSHLPNGLQSMLSILCMLKVTISLLFAWWGHLMVLSVSFFL